MMRKRPGNVILNAFLNFIVFVVQIFKMFCCINMYIYTGLKFVTVYF